MTEEQKDANDATARKKAKNKAKNERRKARKAEAKKKAEEEKDKSQAEQKSNDDEAKASDKSDSSGRTFWTALYGDDETGDLWDNELIAYGIDYVDGRMPGHVAMKTSHPRASIDEGTESNHELSLQTPEDYEYWHLSRESCSILISIGTSVGNPAQY